MQQGNIANREGNKRFDLKADMEIVRQEHAVGNKPSVWKIMVFPKRTEKVIFD